MICRVSTILKKMHISATRNPTFGENAFLILSDGTEAQTSVKLILDDEANRSDGSEEADPDFGTPAKPAPGEEKPLPR